jgi:hypothetical protein
MTDRTALPSQSRHPRTEESTAVTRTLKDRGERKLWIGSKVGEAMLAGTID